jgi:alpha-L-fucosidase 2
VPSQSPENTFEEGNRRAPVTLCVNSSSDLEMIWDLLTHAVRAAEILGADPDKRRLWSGMLERLPVPGVGSKGQLLEWNREFRECEPGHRHVSHLFGLFPGEQFCPFRTPELYRAACRALELRLAAGGGHTGWSRAWMACLFARMGQGDLAMTHLEHLITDFASRSLLDLHPPRIFQIDGNLGGVAAVQEMLLQSYHGDLHLLPALPANWPEGDVKGLRARGAFDVDIAWRGGAVVEARITSRKGTPCRIVDPQGSLAVRTAGGAAVALKRDGHVVTFATTPGATYTVAPKNA